MGEVLKDYVQNVKSMLTKKEFEDFCNGDRSIVKGLMKERKIHYLRRDRDGKIIKQEDSMALDSGRNPPSVQFAS